MPVGPGSPVPRNPAFLILPIHLSLPRSGLISNKRNVTGRRIHISIYHVKTSEDSIDQR